MIVREDHSRTISSPLGVKSSSHGPPTSQTSSFRTAHPNVPSSRAGRDRTSAKTKSWRRRTAGSCVDEGARRQWAETRTSTGRSEGSGGSVPVSGRRRTREPAPSPRGRRPWYSGLTSKESAFPQSRIASAPTLTTPSPASMKPKTVEIGPGLPPGPLTWSAERTATQPTWSGSSCRVRREYAAASDASATEYRVTDPFPELAHDAIAGRCARLPVVRTPGPCANEGGRSSNPTVGDIGERSLRSAGGMHLWCAGLNSRYVPCPLGVPHVRRPEHEEAPRRARCSRIDLAIS